MLQLLTNFKNLSNSGKKIYLDIFIIFLLNKDHLHLKMIKSIIDIRALFGYISLMT